MYKISKWKLVLIILIFLVSGLYLLPTIPGVYGRLYGYFDIWMQGRIPPPDIQSGKDGDYIRFTIPKDNLPKGINIQEASQAIKDIVTRRFTKIGLAESQYVFEDTPDGYLHIKFSPMKTRDELEKLLDKMQLYGRIPIAIRPVFPDNPIKQGLDLKGGMHVVLELDVKKAMDEYLSGQGKDMIIGNLKSEKIFAKSVEKKLERIGDNTIVLRPYVLPDSSISEAQYMAELRQKLIDMGVNEADIRDISKEGPELTATIDPEWDTGDLVDRLLDGNNSIIVNITVPERYQGSDREDYINDAEKVLDRLQYFDKPKRLSSPRAKENSIISSVRLSEESVEELSKENIDTVMKTLENRINKFGVAESTIRRVRNRPRILIEIPEEQNPTRTLSAIKSPGVLIFKLVLTNPITGTPWYGSEGIPLPAPTDLPPGAEIRFDVDNNWYVLDSEVFLQGSDLKSNSAGVVRGEFGTPEVAMYLTSDGQRKFSEFTGQHVNELTAILLDDVIQSAPRITEKISSPSARITGQFTEEEADYLAKILRAGAFPAPMKSAEERIVGPTLGAAAIHRAKLAFALGASLVILFMLVYYKWAGAIAVTALAFQIQIVLGILAGFGATLTLPGMAGLILTIGMSVDANVLIFERIREELRSGKTIRSAIDTGYSKALSAILDSNVTTIITSLVLYEFGTGPIKGFAVTLMVGIGTNLFTAIIVTREIFNWTHYRRRHLVKLSI